MTAVRRAWRGSGPHIGTFAGIGNHITAADDAFVAMLGYDRARFDADRAARVPLSPPRWQAVDEAALARAAGQWGRAETYEKAFLRSDGTEQPVLVTFGLDPRDPDRWVGYAIALSTTRHPPVGSTDPGEDVTEGRHAELIGELLRDRHRITTMLDATSDLIWSVDDGLLLRGANVAFVETVERAVGWRPTPGDHVLPPLFDDDETSTWRELYRRALAGEIFSQRYDGHGGWSEVRLAPNRDLHGRIIGATVVSSDISETVTAEQVAEQRQRLLAIAGRLGRVAAWTLDPGAREVTLSSELIEMFGLLDRAVRPVEETLRFFPPDARTAIADDLEQCLTQRTPLSRDVRMEPGDDGITWVRLLGTARSGEDGQVLAVHGAVADVSEEYARTAQIREQASLLDNASDAILVRGLDGTVRYWNRAAEDLFGWTAAEAIGRHIADLVDAGDHEKYARIEALLLDEGEWAGRIENTDRDGNPLILDLHLTLVTDETGRPVAAFSIARDVSEQVALERRLAQSQKLELIGQLAGGVAHDFNNLLTVISGSAELLAEMVAGDPEAASLLEMMLAATARGGDLTGRLLAAARRQPLRPRIVDPVEAVGHAIELLRRSLPEAIEIVVSGPDAPWPISIDPAQLEAAILNLALNARDAMDGRGRITVVIDHMTVAESPDGDIAPGDYVRLSVTDVGRGMDETVRSRAFDPFFTTKPAGTGSGLGLSMVQGFARQSGGSAEIHSSPGGGTTVVLLFPKAGATPIDRVGRGGDGDLPRGHERILVVEDDPLVREQTVASLVRLGYQVESVGDADTALTRLDDGDPAIELVFSDVVMPGRLDGADLATEIGRRWPNLPVILTSGYHEQQHRPVPAGITFIPKPYRRRMVARAIRRALDRVAR